MYGLKLTRPALPSRITISGIDIPGIAISGVTIFGIAIPDIATQGSETLDNAARAKDTLGRFTLCKMSKRHFRLWLSAQCASNLCAYLY